MGKFARGEVVLVNFPFSDLSGSKLRPALVLQEVEYGDLLLCQITSKHYGTRSAVKIEAGDFASGALPRLSYARPSRILTGSGSLVKRSLGMLTTEKHEEIINEVEKLLH